MFILLVQHVYNLRRLVLGNKNLNLHFSLRPLLAHLVECYECGSAINQYIRSALPIYEDIISLVISNNSLDVP